MIGAPRSGSAAKKEGVVATPITHEGRIYVGAQNGRFACLDLATGKIVWQVEKKAFFEGSAAVADGLVIAGCGDAFVYAWKIGDGAEAWKFETDGEIHAGVNLWKDAGRKILRPHRQLRQPALLPRGRDRQEGLGL